MPRGAAVRNRSVTKFNFCGAYSPLVVRPTKCSDYYSSDSYIFCPWQCFSCQDEALLIHITLPEPKAVMEEKPRRLSVLSYKPLSTSSMHDVSKVLMVLRPVGTINQWKGKPPEQFFGSVGLY